MNVPSPMYSAANGPGRGRGIPTYCFRKNKFLTIYFDPNIVFKVFRLFFFGSPPAVFWGIIFASINSVYGVIFGRFLAHVFEEKLKAFFPSLTYRYSLSPISAVPNIVGVICSGFHCLPSNVLWTLYLETRSPVTFGNSSAFLRKIFSSFYARTPARFRVSASEVCSKNVSFVTTRTATQENFSPASVPFRQLFNNGESSKCFAYHQ